MSLPDAAFDDPRAATAFGALMAQREEVFGWLSNGEGMEHFDVQVTRKDRFRYLMHAHSGSLVLLYQPTAAATWDDAKVVVSWEGKPVVVAESLGEWLTLLPWPVVGDFATALMMHELIPATYEAPQEALAGAALERIAAGARAEPGYDEIVAHLTGAGFAPTADPIGVICRARATDPDVAL